MEKAVDGYSHDRDPPRLEQTNSPLKAPRSHNDRIAEWFDKWNRHIRGFLRKRGSVPASDVDDLTQEVFLRLLRYSNETEIENPLGYLFRVTSNVANEWRERSRVKLPHDAGPLAELQSEPNDEPEIAFAQTQRDEHIRAAVKRLPVRRREVLLSHVEHGMTCKQIAQARGLTNRIVVRDLTRAYSALRLQLKLEDL